MVEESTPPLATAEESIEAGTDTARKAEPESGEPTPELTGEPDFACACGESMRSACKGLPFYKQHENKSYCILHYPGKEKAADFKAALDRKLNGKDFDFRGVWFPEQVNFRGLEFSTAANFSDATFNGESNFSSATFSADVYFRYATFSADAYFISAMFSASASFSSATFSADAYFSSATFSANASFRCAKFRAGAYFNESLFDASVSFFEASFAGSVQFFGTAERELQEAAVALGDNPSLDFQLIIVEHPDRIVFQTLILRPHWFVNVDSRRFDFTDVSWDWGHISINEEIAALKAKNVSSRNRLLAIACRQLAENAEANNRYEEASRFRYWAMDLALRSKWKGWMFWKTDWLHVLYWAVSGYGERILQALGVLAAVWFVFMLLYTQVGFVPQRPQPSNNSSSSAAASDNTEDRVGEPLEVRRALIYSLAVMSLQKPDPKPLTGTAQMLVLLETILGPLQAALLALAIRRKFMR